jgi:hypothetical protein
MPRGIRPPIVVQLHAADAVFLPEPVRNACPRSTVAPNEIKTSQRNSDMEHMTRMNFEYAIVTPTCSPVELIA